MSNSALRLAASIGVLSSLVGLSGCGQTVQPAAAAAAGQNQPPPAERPAPQSDEDVKHPLVRALLEALHDTDADEADIRSVRQMLYDADAELMSVTGGESRREAILRANEKPPVLLIQPEYVPPAEAEPGSDDAVPAPAEPADPSTPPSADTPADPFSPEGGDRS